MFEGMSFGGWTVIGPHPSGGKDAHVAANALGEEAVLRITAISDQAVADGLTRAAEAAAAVTHPNVAKILGWGVVEPPAPLPEPVAEPVAEPPVASEVAPEPELVAPLPEPLPDAEPDAGSDPAADRDEPLEDDPASAEPSLFEPEPEVPAAPEDVAAELPVLDASDDLSAAIAEATGSPEPVAAPEFAPEFAPDLAPELAPEAAPELAEPVVPAPPVPTTPLFWCAEEHVPGTTLEALFGHAGGRMPVADAAHWAAQVASGLSALHAHRVILGDLRPQTIVVSPEGDARITCVVPPRLGAPDPSASPEAAYYVSPELAHGAQLAAQSDIYSLGAILYRAVTGSVVFDGPSAGDVAIQHGTAPPEPLRRVNPQIPASFEQVVLRMLAKDPSARYGSAEELRQDLERVAGGGSIMGRGVPMVSMREEEPRGPRRGTPAWVWVLLATVAFLLFAAGGAWAYTYFSKPVVPDVAGMTETQAAAVLEEAGFVLGDIAYRSPAPSGVETGSVLGQDPAAGQRVADGSLVSIVIAGAKTLPVPSVVGLTQTEAILKIQQAGFTLGAIETTAGTIENRDKVISQDPPGATELPEGAPVGITISRGPELVSVPSVTATTQVAARKALEAAGFMVVIQTEPSAATSGTVTRQLPEAGGTAVKGSKVTIWIAQPTIPNVIGMSRNSATSALRKLGLRVTSVDETRTGTSSGFVFDQDPNAGGAAVPNSTIKIWVAK